MTLPETNNTERLQAIRRIVAMGAGVYHPDAEWLLAQNTELRDALAAHREIESPRWDTKTHCACGGRFASRCEWALHRSREADAVLLGEGEQE